MSQSQQKRPTFDQIEELVMHLPFDERNKLRQRLQDNSSTPALEFIPIEKTSDETDSYNCVAWVMGDTTKCWWPKSYGTLVPYYWPFESDSDDTDVFIRTFESYGYSICESGELENGFEKLAIYIDVTG